MHDAATGFPLLIDARKAGRQCRLAAALFFFVCVPLALFDQMYVPAKIYVPGHPAATMRQMLSNEWLYRLSILSHLAGIMVFFMLVWLFAHVLMPFSRQLAWLMILPIVMQVSVVFVFEVCHYTALMMVKGNAPPGVAMEEQQELAFLLMRVARYGTGAGIGKFFLGICFIAFGMLVKHSKLAPAVIGILLITGGAGYLADTSIHILLPRNDYIQVRSYLLYTTLCYALALLWFLIMGVRKPLPSTGK